MTDRPRCRARPDPVLAVEAFLRERPGVYRPDEIAGAMARSLEPSAVAAVVAYLLESERAVLDDEGCLVCCG